MCWAFHLSSGQWGECHLAHVLEFHTSGMSHMRVVLWWLVLNNSWPRQPKEDKIVSQIDQHNSISPQGPVMSRFWSGHSTLSTSECHVSSQSFAPFGGTGDEPNKDLGVLFSCPADIILNITNCEILRRCMLIVRKIGQVSLVRCTNDWHNCRSGMTLILHIPPPISSVHFAVNCPAFQACEEHWFNIKVHPKSEMSQKPLCTVENIPVV